MKTKRYCLIDEHPQDIKFYFEIAGDKNYDEKKQMVEEIIDLFNKHANGKLSDKQKGYIVSVTCNGNSKETIKRQYWMVCDLEKTQHMSSDIAIRRNNAIWVLIYINICPGN